MPLDQSTMTEAEMIERGKQVFEQCYRGVVPMPAKVEPKGYSGMSMKMFNDYWGGIDLPMREKRIMVLGVLAGMGADVSLFEIHAKCALRNGEVSPEELRGLILMALPYVGFPRASPIYVMSERLIAEYQSGALD